MGFILKNCALYLLFTPIVSRYSARIIWLPAFCFPLYVILDSGDIHPGVPCSGAAVELRLSVERGGGVRAGYAGGEAG